MRKVPLPMARSGILIHGLRKQMSFSWINRNHFLLLDTLKLNISSIASELVFPTLIMGKRSKQLKTRPRTSMPLFRSSSRHSRGSLRDHSISQENHTGFVPFSVSSIKSLTQFLGTIYTSVCKRDNRPEPSCYARGTSNNKFEECSYWKRHY